VTVLDTGAVQAFHEKRAGDTGGLINGGVYLLARDVVESIPPGEPVSLEREVFPQLVGHGLHAVVGEGPFIDIGTPESYAQLRELSPWEFFGLPKQPV
jgi:NDP-sugar pyrophosphorylase family protein